MEIGFVLLCVTLVATATPVSAQTDIGIIESLLLATQQRPWLWSVYVFTVGLPVILFISFMWPDKRFGPPEQQYYYKKCDEVQPDDLEVSKWTQSKDNTGTSEKAIAKRRDVHGNHRKPNLDLKDH